jgi:hypothetical protein
MLFAKLALGFCGTVAAAGAYTFHDGILRVETRQSDGRQVQVWLPAAIVPMAMHVIPSRHLSHATAQVRPWLPTLRALTKELKRYPDAEFVDVEDGTDHVRIRTQHGKLLIDVSEPGETVHVACPLAVIEEVSSQLEAQGPAA